MLQRVKELLPESARRRLRTWKRRATTPAAQFGTLRRLTPLSNSWGFDRGIGQPIDRYYIEKFLGQHAKDVRGHVVEIGGSEYTRAFGGANVSESEIWHVSGCQGVTIKADLTSASQLASDRFDCFICTQTLQFIYDVPAAIRTIHRVLKPGAVALATFAGISKISPRDRDRYGEFWRVTSMSAARLFGDVFGTAHTEVSAYGNVLTAIAFLHGLSSDELSRSELDHNDPCFEVIVAVRATKNAQVVVA
jgi:hypothetical protein